MSTVFRDEYPVWRTGRAADQPFTVKCEIRFPEETIKYPLNIITSKVSCKEAAFVF